nr:DUF1987 domain-containing protein [Candidatus Cloacimonadota bacterium]
MNNFVTEESKYTMAVNLDAATGLCKMQGNSYPEDAISFFEPLNKWFEQYIEEVNKPLIVEIQLNYLNSSSSKCFMDLFDLFEDYSNDGGEVIVKWFFAKDDDEIKEAGEEL